MEVSTAQELPLRGIVRGSAVLVYLILVPSSAAPQFHDDSAADSFQVGG